MKCKKFLHLKGSFCSKKCKIGNEYCKTHSKPSTPWLHRQCDHNWNISNHWSRVFLEKPENIIKLQENEIIYKEIFHEDIINVCLICSAKKTDNLDHLRPLISNSRYTGETHCPLNRIPICTRCNSSKGNKSLSEIKIVDGIFYEERLKAFELIISEEISQKRIVAPQHIIDMANQKIIQNKVRLVQEELERKMFINEINFKKTL